MPVYQKHPRAKLVAVCDTVAERAESAAERFGAEFVSTDFAQVLERGDVDAVDIATPNVSHAAISLAALKAGKHVMCEKPMAMSYEEAEHMYRAAKEADVKTGINFVYRRHPAARFARHIVEQGHIGRVFHVNAFYMQSWLIDPELPLVWRMQKEVTGTGVLGDLGSHIIDLVEWITGERIKAIVADMQTFIRERPLPDGSGTGQVDVDDDTNLLARFENGATGVFVTSRYGTGQTNYQRIEIYGDKGSVIYSWDDVSHVRAALGPVFIRERVMAPIPVPRRFKSPIPEDEHNVSGNIRAFIQAILEDGDMEPGFQDGLRNQEILEAVEISARDRCWVELPLSNSFAMQQAVL